MVVPISVRCPHCQAKLKLPSEKLLGKKLPCPKCKTTIVLKAASKNESVSQVKSAADTHPDIDELSQTQTQVPSSAEQSSKPPTSLNVSLGGLSGELVPLDEEEQAEEKQRREADKKQDGEDTYRLSGDRIPSSPTPKPIEFDDSDDDEWDDSRDERTHGRAEQMPPVAEAIPDELDLMDALEGLAKQEKSKPSRRRKKITKGPTRKRKHT